MILHIGRFLRDPASKEAGSRKQNPHVKRDEKSRGQRAAGNSHAWVYVCANMSPMWCASCSLSSNIWRCTTIFFMTVSGCFRDGVIRESVTKIILELRVQEVCRTSDEVRVLFHDTLFMI